MQIYTYTLEYTSDGKPSCYSYHFYKEYENTDEPSDDTDSLTFTYEKDSLAKVVCVQETNDYSDRTFLYDADGNLISEDHMRGSIGSGDIGARSYEYYDNGILAKMNLYHDFTEEDSSKIQESWCYDETGRLSAKEDRDGDIVKNRDYYSETGNVIKHESFGEDDNGNTYLEASKSFDELGNTTEMIRYWENGNIYTKEIFNEHDMHTYQYCANVYGVCSYEGSMTGDNEYTEIWYDKDGNIEEKYVYTYGEDSYSYVKYDGSGAEVKRLENKEYKR